MKWFFCFGIKLWTFLTTQGGDLAHNFKDQDHILDIFSGILHLAGDSLVPKSIDKSSLEDAKVLNQVDKKFIAVVAGRTLAVIDQVNAFHLMTLFNNISA